MLEQLVRPRQTPQVLPTRRIISKSTKIPDQVAALTWGAAGDLPAASEVERDPELGFEFRVIDCDNRFTEMKRTSVPVLVENPEDDDQYLVYDRVEDIKFKEKKKTEPGNPYNQKTAAYPGDGEDGKPVNSIMGTIGAQQINVLVDESKLCGNKFKLYNQGRPGHVVGDPEELKNPDPYNPPPKPEKSTKWFKSGTIYVKVEE